MGCSKRPARNKATSDTVKDGFTTFTRVAAFVHESANEACVMVQERRFTAAKAEQADALGGKDVELDGLSQFRSNVRVAVECEMFYFGSDDFS